MHVIIIHAVQTEIQMVSAGGNVCFDIELNGPVYAFWPQRTGSSTNCICPVPHISTVISFSDCYCIKLQETDFTVTFNTTTAELCWKNVDLAANGSAVGIINEENLDNCGDYSYSTTQTYTKMVIILVEELSQVPSANIVGKLCC